MSNVAAVSEIRRRLGLSLRESMDAFNKYGSVDAAVAALSTPEAMSAWQGPYEELAKERRYSSAVLAVAVELYERFNHDPRISARDAVAKLVKEKLEHPR